MKPKENRRAHRSGEESVDDWLERQNPKTCACGCDEPVVIKKNHHYLGIPNFILGHHVRVKHANYKGVDKWMEAEQGKHYCVCGCNKPIRIRARHHDQGIPRYLPNHHPPPRIAGPNHPSFIKDRSRVRRRGNNFTLPVMREIRERCEGRCVRCGSFDDKIEYDHIIPVSAGGTGEASNGQLLCRECHHLKNYFDRVLTGSPEHIRRFFGSLVAFLDRAQEEVARYVNHRNAAHIP